MIHANSPLVPNPLNIISQPPENSGSQLSLFVDATQDFENHGNKAVNEDSNFLHNSWANLEELDEEPIIDEGAFSNAVSILRKKQSTQLKKNTPPGLKQDPLNLPHEVPLLEH